MFKKLRLEVSVGLFVVLTFLALIFLALRVASQESLIRGAHHYTIHADFDNVSGLRARAPVRVAGVRIGQIKTIEIDAKTYRAHVTMDIEENDLILPVDTSASILTEGLLGARYISLSPGFSPEALEEDGEVVRTNSAMILENLIGAFLFKSDDKEGGKS